MSEVILKINRKYLFKALTLLLVSIIIYQLIIFKTRKLSLKKILAIGDLHCGHLGGLTPPKYMVTRQANHSVYKLQKKIWDLWLKTLSSVGKIDYLIVNGDTIDGKGTRSGGIELLTGDLFQQAEIAIECIKMIPTKEILMTYGTAYHVASGSGEDMEYYIAKQCNAEIHSQLHWKVKGEGVTVNAKHHIGGSSTPYSRNTSPNKDMIWNVLWSDIGEQPRGNLFIRSHIHSYNMSENNLGMVVTLPALQAPRTIFGARRCSGTVDWGVVKFTIDKNIIKYDKYIHRLNGAKEELIIK